METTLIATTPAAMESAQGQMIAWANAKEADVSGEIATLRADLVVAERNKWNTASIKRRIKREGKRLVFYAKIRKALEAGFYVVPNFGGKAFAIRTNAERVQRATTYSYVSAGDFLQPIPMLSAGEGRYIGPQASGEQIDDEIKIDASGKVEKRTQRFAALDFQAVDFPIALMRPQVMEATERAMAIRVFDEILEARDRMRCGDPMILGRLRNPLPNRPDVTFFIAWVMPLDRI